MAVPYPVFSTIDGLVPYEVRILMNSIRRLSDVWLVPTNRLAVAGKDDVALNEVCTLQMLTVQNRATRSARLAVRWP